MDNVMVIIWLVVLILMILVEVATMGLTSIWFAGGALISIFAAMIGAPIWLQIILFFAVSLLLLFSTRPIAVKYFNKNRTKTNVDSLIGRQAIVITAIDNLKATGQVAVGGQEWSARGPESNSRIESGAVVRITAINGVKLIVVPEGQYVEMTKHEISPKSVSEMEEIAAYDKE
ncbi:MAG: NfeD family protein [Acetatifactor sp.]